MADNGRPAPTDQREKAIALVKASYEAYVAKDRAALERILSDDFHFTSPLDNRLERATYFARCWPNSAKLRDFEFVNLATVDGETVFVTYIATNSEGERFQNTEIMTVRDGKIAEVDVYFGWSLPHEAKLGGFINQ
jgi:ketosteroid isomerase-like protein